MDRIGCFVTTGLWPERCVAGTAGSTSRAGTRGRYGWPPAALSQDRCVALAGSGGCAAPRGSCLRSGTSPWPAGNQVWPVGVALAGGSLRVARCAGVAAPEAAVAPVTLRVTWHLPRLHAPEPRTGAPVQASVRRASGETRTVRSNGAAPVGAGGKWVELWATAGNARKCVRQRLESARTRYGRAGEAPCHSGARTVFALRGVVVRVAAVDAPKGSRDKASCPVAC